MEGYLDAADCTLIQGWGWNGINDDGVEVRVASDTVVFATVVANVLRDDLAAAGKGNGRHGFSLPLPDSLKDGKVHNITATFADGTALQGALSITCAPAVIVSPPVPPVGSPFVDVPVLKFMSVFCVVQADKYSWVGTLREAKALPGTAYEVKLPREKPALLQWLNANVKG